MKKKKLLESGMKQKFFFLCALSWLCDADASVKRTPDPLEDDSGSETTSSESIDSTELEQGWQEINQELHDLQAQNRTNLKKAIDAITRLIMKRRGQHSQASLSAKEQKALAALVDEVNEHVTLQNLLSISRKRSHSMTVNRIYPQITETSEDAASPHGGKK